LEEKEEIHVELEKEIVVLRRKLQKENTKKNFNKSTKILNQIIDSQIPIHDKIGLGYNQRNDELGPSSKTTKDDKKSYMYIVKDLQEVGTSKHEENEHAKKQAPATQRSNPRGQAPSRRPPMPRYQNFFSGLCYACNKYGHKAIDCRTYIRSGYNWGRRRYESPKYQEERNDSGRSQMGPNKNYNRFEALDYGIECYICHNFGHIARKCRSKITGPQDQSRENRQASVRQTKWKVRQED
jgi:hypothetical protein